MSGDDWQVIILHALATIGAAVLGIGIAAGIAHVLGGGSAMGPEKAAANILHCDGCGHLVSKGAAYRIDAHGYLLCVECAAKGDAERTVAV